MSPPIASCVICGEYIGDPGKYSGKWRDEFRAIYSTPDGGYFLSGIGWYVYEADMFQAPTDSTKRLDDEDCDPHSVESFFEKMYFEGRHTFMVHPSCWNLLKEAFSPGEISLKRFVEVCDSLSLSLSTSCFTWGHTYGGTWCFDRLDGDVWDCDLRGRPSDYKEYAYAQENPYQIPEITTLLSTTSHKPKRLGGSVLGLYSDNRFGYLPWEIRQKIAILLPTRDALALRQASKTFLYLLDSPTFWASRFRPGAEREFFFEKRKTAEVRDWLSLYRMTSLNQSPPGLKNRQRIWGLIKYIMQLMNSCLDSPIEPITLNDSSSCPESMFIKFTANIVEPTPLPRVGLDPPAYSVCRHGCRAFWAQSALIPRDLMAISVSSIGLGDLGYISGLRFQSKSGAVTQLGYFSAENQVQVDIEYLKGFVLAVSPLGIRALQVVDKKGNRSPWVGFPKDMPVTERLVEFDTSEPMHAKIDGYKIVELRAKRLESDQDSLSTPSRSKLSLRTTALWYPCVPSSDKILNEISFTGEIPPNDAFAPIFWVDFGGPKGENLQYLERINLGAINSWGEYGDPAVISFQFQDTSLIKPMNFGYQDLSEIDEEQQIFFDSQIGERIHIVEVVSSKIVSTLKLTTNKGNSFWVGHPPPSRRIVQDTDGPSNSETTCSSKSGLVTLTYDPLTTITGFYATMDGANFKSLGVISEVIEDA